MLKNIPLKETESEIKHYANAVQELEKSSPELLFSITLYRLNSNGPITESFFSTKENARARLVYILAEMGIHFTKIKPYEKSNHFDVVEIKPNRGSVRPSSKLVEECK